IMENSTGFAYDSDNKLIRIDDESYVTEFGYAPDGHRYSKSEDGLPTTYYAANGLFEHRPSDNRYMHYISAGNEGVVAAVAVSADSGSDYTVAYLHRDHLGSIYQVSGASGEILEQYWYDPWGNTIESDGTIIDQVETYRGFTA